jgi:hypothetical protein
MGQFGFFDADKRLAAISAKGDPLEMIDWVVRQGPTRGNRGRSHGQGNDAGFEPGNGRSPCLTGSRLLSGSSPK